MLSRATNLLKSFALPPRRVLHHQPVWLVPRPVNYYPEPKHVIFLQENLDVYMQSVFVPMPTVCTNGMDLYWQLRLYEWQAKDVVQYLALRYGIRIDAVPDINALVVSPPVDARWPEVKGALDLVADLLRPTHIQSKFVEI